MKQLNKREKNLLIILAILMVVAVIYYIATNPFKNISLSTSANNKPDYSAKVDQLRSIYSRYMITKEKIQFYEKQLNSTNDNITSLVQTLAKQENIDDNIGYTRRTQTNIQNKYTRINTDVKINGVDIQSLLRFIQKIENNESLIFVSYLHINKGLKGTDKYDALIKIHTFVKK